jgi:hypothetical protein
MEQAGDHFNAERIQPFQSVVGPGEIALVRMERRNALPQDGIADRSDAERGDLVNILGPVAMAGLDQLIAPPIPDPHDRAFRPGPELKRRQL